MTDEEAHLDFLIRRQGFIIKNYCNTIGCKDCPLQRDDGGCESTDLNSNIREMELKQKGLNCN